MTDILLSLIGALTLTHLLISLFKKKRTDIAPRLEEIAASTRQFEKSLQKNEKSIGDEFERNRKESREMAHENRKELAETLASFEKQFAKNISALNESLRQRFADFSLQQNDLNAQSTGRIKEIKQAVDHQLQTIREDNTKQLDQIRHTVDEKLQKTLEQRLQQSFQTVSAQLQVVSRGLGEMRTLATDVGGLKKALSNVKMRGNIGEVQLSMLLEQILAPQQYEANVSVKPGSGNVVEFAIKLPGRDESDKCVWLPIDAKFPKEVYEYLQEAYERGEPDRIAEAQKQFEQTIKKMAKDISEKYLSPPDTTDFGILFLPFEGMYAEVVRKAALLEDLRYRYKIVITGPSTLAATLMSLQMGFKTLAIQRRSSEVWKVLGKVKKEFENFGGIMQKAQKNIQTGLNQLDEVMGKRTRAIQRELKDVQTLNEPQAQSALPDRMPAEAPPAPQEPYPSQNAFDA